MQSIFSRLLIEFFLIRMPTNITIVSVWCLCLFLLEPRFFPCFFFFFLCVSYGFLQHYVGMDPIITSFANEELLFLLLFIIFNNILYLWDPTTNFELRNFWCLMQKVVQFFKNSLLSKLLIYGHEGRLWCDYKSNYGKSNLKMLSCVLGIAPHFATLYK